MTDKKVTKKKSGKLAKAIEKREIKKEFWFKLNDKEKKHHADEAFRIKTEQIKKELAADIRELEERVI